MYMVLFFKFFFFNVFSEVVTGFYSLVKTDAPCHDIRSI